MDEKDFNTKRAHFLPKKFHTTFSEVVQALAANIFSCCTNISHCQNAFVKHVENNYYKN